MLTHNPGLKFLKLLIQHTTNSTNPLHIKSMISPIGYIRNLRTTVSAVTVLIRFTHANARSLPPAFGASKNLTTEVVRRLCSHYLSSQAVARQVLSAYMSLTSVFGMGTGGPS